MAKCRTTKTSTDEVQSTREYKNKGPSRVVDVSVVPVKTNEQARKIKTKKQERNRCK
jgi:hypothetical protein